MLQRLPIALAQLKAGSTSEKYVLFFIGILTCFMSHRPFENGYNIYKF